MRASRIPSAIRPPLDHAPPGDEAAVGVQQQDAHHDPDAEREDDHDEVLGLEPEGLLRERRPEHAEDADQGRGDHEVDQGPADPRMVPDEVDPLAELGGDGPSASSASRRRPCEVSGPPRLRSGGAAGSVQQKTRRHEVEERDDGDEDRCAGDLHDQRPEQREPEGERRVQRQREDPVGREQLLLRDEHRDHRRLGRAEEDVDRRDRDVQQVEQEQVIADEVDATNARPRSTFVETSTSRLSSRSTKTPASAENSTAGRRNVKISARRRCSSRSTR
jgi:hypothetical protein